MNAGGPDVSERPWGYFVVLEDGCTYKVKRIVVRPGMRLSLQRHRHRREHWLVLTGTALVTRDSETVRLQPGDALDIAAGQLHRLENPGPDDLEIIEIQQGSSCAEDDIERLEDDFGRA